jgi:hypothetical protein
LQNDSFIQLNLSAFHIFGESTRQVPDVLTERHQAYTYVLLLFVSVSIFMLALARNRNTDSFRVVFQSVFKVYGIDQFIKENLRIESASSVFLIANYFISASLCTFLALQRGMGLSYSESLLIAVLAPLVLFAVETLFIPMVGFIAGDNRLHVITREHTLTGFQFSGLVCTVLSFFWVLHTFDDRLMLFLFTITILFQLILRVVKEFWCVLQAGVMWYYIILYLCTLEILPLLAAFQYVSEVFLR